MLRGPQTGREKTLSAPAPVYLKETVKASVQIKYDSFSSSIGL